MKFFLLVLLGVFSFIYLFRWPLIALIALISFIAHGPLEMVTYPLIFWFVLFTIDALLTLFIGRDAIRKFAVNFVRDINNRKRF